MYRNLSIDSTVSSISSSTSQPPRSNPSPNNRLNNLPDGELDLNSLVAQTGSLELALQQIWKDKQNATSHNAQLWRLVEKQRAMILGLQKDLERALKEKERYRKKWKDQQPALMPRDATSIASEREASTSSTAKDPNPNNDLSRNVSSHSLSTTTSSTTSALESKNASSATITSLTPHNQTLLDPVDSDQHIQSQSLANKVKDPEPDFSRPKQLSAAFADQHSPFGSDLTSIDASPITSASLRNEESVERAQTPLTEPSQILESSPKEAEALAFRVEKRRPSAISIIGPPTSSPPAGLSVKAPSLAITNPTPTIDSGSFPSPPKPSLGGRKSIPAPLNLAQSNLSPPSQQVQFADQSPVIAVRGDDQVEDNIEDDLDRGRRRTREDDDRIREAIALREEEVRSLSKKKGKSKSATATPLASPTIPLTHPSKSVEETLAKMPIPSQSLSPVQEVLDATVISPTSINPASLLSPSVSESSISSTAAQRSSFVAPILSPGLPMSPRPGHRPANSPAPRFPKPQLSASNVTSVARASPHLTPLSGDSEEAPNVSSSRPTTPHQSQSAEDDVAFSSPSAIPAPLFARKSSSSSPHLNLPATQSTPRQASLESNSRTNIQADSTEKVSNLIYRGFISDQYPDLLLPPNALSLIDVRVFSSRLRPSRNSILLAKPLDEDPVFLLGIYSKSDKKQLWRLEKTIHALPSLHSRVKSVSSFTGKLPDPTLFQGHAPAKIDARRAALNAYFDMLLDSTLSEDAALVLCHFFSTDAIDPEKDSIKTAPKATSAAVKSTGTTISDPTRREGYLTKRGKNFGGWKARYFILDGPELKYYDDQAGPQVGVIKLISAQIGKQSSNPSNQSPAGRDDEDNQYRHAFLILEPKKRDSSSVVRHVLCAESDEERDAWVAACLTYVNYKSDKRTRDSHAVKPHTESLGSNPGGLPTIMQSRAFTPTPVSMTLQEGSRERGTPSSVVSSVKESNDQQNSYFTTFMTERNTESPQPSDKIITTETQTNSNDESAQVVGVSYEQTVPAEAPIIGQTSYHSRASHIPPIPKPHKEVMISGPTNGAPIQNMEMWGLKTPTPAKEKKRSIFGFRGRSSSDLNIPYSRDVPSTPGPDSRPPPKNVFGIPLLEAVECSQPIGVDVFVPAVVYRCIEYLRAQEAVSEEGLFRLSGSNVTIKALRERFTQEGDVKLLDDEYYDVHAVASLLKLYLRELPNSILSRDLHLDFLKVNDLTDHEKKAAVCNVLVHKLPKANLALLDTLCSFLIEVVHNSDRNKMNVRNGMLLFIVHVTTTNLSSWNCLCPNSQHTSLAHFAILDRLRANLW
jgi:RalA-binding protein 1